MSASDDGTQMKPKRPKRSPPMLFPASRIEKTKAKLASISAR
jgi:hypothetical protein